MSPLGKGGAAATVATQTAHISPRTIDEFRAANPMADEVRDEDYWDLAWHARVADYGDMHSQFVLAQAYEFGRSIEANPQKALSFYKKAAQQGHFEACMRLGEIYTENKWVKADREQSLFWYQRAAENGYAPAQLKLSDLYEMGKKKNYEESYYWLAMATKQSFPHESDFEQKAPHLKTLADKMTPEEYEHVLMRLAP
ncbi:MAG: tetratricopeptide repeat protein [Alphaproteobacteria bacterium]